MRSKSGIVFWLILTLISLNACGQTVTPQNTPSSTAIPSSTPTLASTPTLTPIPTRTPYIYPTFTNTPEPIFVTLGSPFSPNCGDGKVRIFTNDSFNGPYKNAFDDHHGHMDVLPPQGCNILSLKGGIVAPASGTIQIAGSGYFLVLPNNVYISGTLDALKFAKIDNPKLNLIRSTALNFGHLANVVSGYVNKGDSIGDLVISQGSGINKIKLAYQITIQYGTTEYMLSPTLFVQDNIWVCYPTPIGSCVATPYNYPH